MTGTTESHSALLTPTAEQTTCAQHGPSATDRLPPRSHLGTNSADKPFMQQKAKFIKAKSNVSVNIPVESSVMTAEALTSVQSSTTEDSVSPEHWQPCVQANAHGKSIYTLM